MIGYLSTRFSEEKPCNHALYEAHIITEEATGEKGLKSEKAKHSKKVEALSEAESLAKSFKSRRSKKSSKSMKSSKRSSKSAKKTSKEGHEEENHEDGANDKSKTSHKSRRNDGGRDVCVVQMDHGKAVRRQDHILGLQHEHPLSRRRNKLNINLHILFINKGISFVFYWKLNLFNNIICRFLFI